MNRPRSMRAALMAAVVGLVAISQCSEAQEEKTVRPAHCAGTWYHADAARLASQVDGLLDQASPPDITGKPVAVISPHAGYRFSAAAAAAGYRCLRDHRYKRVIVLGFLHSAAGRFQGVGVQREFSAYQTPLGEVPIDQEVVENLWQKRSVFVWHPGIDRGEHSLELQLPFLQRVGKESKFKLVPLLIGHMSASDYAEAARAITPWVDEDTLIVASSDFTHFGPRFLYQPFREDVPTKLRELADRAAAQIMECNFDGFVDYLSQTGDTICGAGPIQLLLRILSMQGGATGVRAAFDTSGHITGDWTNTVTYQSIVLVRRPGKLNPDQRRELLRIARETATAHLNGKKPPEVDADKLPAVLRADGACFVTLKNHGQLRGCIGNMRATGPLYEAVARNAVEACRDPRFLLNPVTAKELDQINVEISHLTPMERITNTDDIIVGRHGLLIGLGGRRGVLLPQVAYEYGWTREEFLAQVCRKAGLPVDAWKRPEAEIYSFEAEVFGEPEPTATRPAGHP